MTKGKSNPRIIKIRKILINIMLILLTINVTEQIVLHYQYNASIISTIIEE